jgi:hypothetical protein
VILVCRRVPDQSPAVPALLWVLEIPMNPARRLGLARLDPMPPVENTNKNQARRAIEFLSWDTLAVDDPLAVGIDLSRYQRGVVLVTNV